MTQLFAAKVRKLAGKLQENEFTNNLHFSEGWKISPKGIYK
jgi:hypothetical protein